MKLSRPSLRTTTENLFAAVFLLLVALLGGALYLLYLDSLPGGSVAGRSWPRAMTETSYRPLVEETERALGWIASAGASLRTDSETAQFDLERTAAALRRLRSYYLPLADARDHAYNAHLLQLAGDTRRAALELGSVREILLATSEGDPHVAHELRRPLSALGAAEAELTTEPREAAEHLEQVGREINLLLIKGDLALAGSGLEYP